MATKKWEFKKITFDDMKEYIEKNAASDKEWFKNVAVSIETARECGMRPWAYDENGWPSGFGNGLVTDLGVTYQQKYLRCKETETAENTDTTITNIEYEGKNLHFYYDINPFYVDTLDGKVTDEFINKYNPAKL